MHGLILGCKGGDHVDPWNTLDNRRKNLRPATSFQNAANRRKRRDGSNARKGVYFISSLNKFVVEIGTNGKVIKVGYFDTFESACTAREEAERRYHGEFARSK